MHLKRLFTGLTVPQQYVCLSLEDFRDPLSVYLSAADRDGFLDVTDAHIFLGYKPLIIAVVFDLGVPQENGTVDLSFVNSGLKPVKASSPFATIKSNTLAKLTLKRVGQRQLQERVIVYYEGQTGKHYFLNPFHQFVNNQREIFRKDTPNNVSLPGNLYDQVRIAYAVPRIVSLITLSNGNKMNMFPTDLHGSCGDDFYVSSLRLGGKANDQIEATGKLVLASMPSEEFKAVYQLGKNHMQDLKDFDQFQVAQLRSKVLEMPLPATALSYRELERIDSFDAGIHRIHFYRVLHAEKIRDGYTLAHIHQYYAQWRIDRKLSLDMLLR